MIRSVIYTFLGAALTIATAWSLGTLVLRRLRALLHSVEEHLLALLTGAACLSVIVFLLCAAGLARKAVFVVLGLIVTTIAIRGYAQRSSLQKLPPLSQQWKLLFGAAFVAITAIYVWTALPPQLTHDSLMYRLSLIGRAHGFIRGTDASVPDAFELVLLYAAVISRYSAAVLVNLVALAALILLVLCYWQRRGYPIVGVAAALLTYLIAVSGKHESLAFSHVGTPLLLFGIVYALQIWDKRGLLTALVLAVALLFVVNPIDYVEIVPFISLTAGLALSDFRRLFVTALRSVPRYAWIVLIVLSPWIVTFTARPATVRGYFWVEQHWLPEPLRDAMKTGVPLLCRIGLLGPARIEVEPGVSFLLDPRDLLAVSILRGGSWQPELWDSIAPDLSEGSVLLDVGAHIGYFSIKAALKVGKTGKVIAFEPNPETLTLLCDNVEFNHAGNVMVEPIACTDREQMLTLYAAPSMNTGASSLARQNADLTYKEPPRPYPVRGRPIDDVARELNLTRVDAIKIDVEGAEVYVLRGTIKTLQRFHPKIVVEIVAEQLAGMHTTPDDLIAVLREAGYNHSRPIGGTDWEWTVEKPGP